MSIRIETFSADGFTADYFRFGKGKKPMVILPGLSVQSVSVAAASVAAEYSVFADDFSVCVVERRKPVPESYTVGEMADDTALVLDGLGLSGVCLFGASQGGMIAMRIAVSRPDLVSKLAVASTALNVTEERSRTVGGWIEEARRGDGVALYTDFGRTVYPPAVFEKYEKALSGMGKTVTEDEFNRFAILADAARGYRSGIRRGDIGCPFFAVGSLDDGVLGGDAIREIVGEFDGTPGFGYHIYEGYGHAAYDTAPDFRDRLFAFFSKD